MNAELHSVKVNPGVIVAKARVGEMLESVNEFVLASGSESRTDAKMAAKRKWNIEIFVANSVFGMYVRTESQFGKRRNSVIGNALIPQNRC